MPRSIWKWYLAALLNLLAGTARADFVISISDLSVPQGGTGTIGVRLYSNASPASPDVLNDLGFTLQITGANELQFSAAQSFAYLSSGQYVFAGDSTAQVTSSPGGTVSQSVYPNDTFVGNDSTFSGNTVSLSSTNTPVLLATLSLNAALTSPGDTYVISLIPLSGNGSLTSSSHTFFDAFDFFNTGTEISAVPFSSSSAMVTISASAVPEPASIVTSLIAIVIVAGVAGRHWLHGTGFPDPVVG